RAPYLFRHLTRRSAVRHPSAVSNPRHYKRRSAILPPFCHPPSANPPPFCHPPSATINGGPPFFRRFRNPPSATSGGCLSGPSYWIPQIRKGSFMGSVLGVIHGVLLNKYVPRHLGILALSDDSVLQTVIARSSRVSIKTLD